MAPIGRSKTGTVSECRVIGARQKAALVHRAAELAFLCLRHVRVHRPGQAITAPRLVWEGRNRCLRVVASGRAEPGWGSGGFSERLPCAPPQKARWSRALCVYTCQERFRSRQLTNGFQLASSRQSDNPCPNACHPSNPRLAMNTRRIPAAAASPVACANWLRLPTCCNQ